MDYVLQRFDRPCDVRRAARVSFMTSRKGMVNRFTGSKSNAHPRVFGGEISIFGKIGVR